MPLLDGLLEALGLRVPTGDVEADGEEDTWALREKDPVLEELSLMLRVGRGLRVTVGDADGDAVASSEAVSDGDGAPVALAFEDAEKNADAEGVPDWLAEMDGEPDGD